MGKIIGAASEFYRLRITRLDESDEPDLEWRDDILYRDPPREQAAEYEAFALEAITLDDSESVTRIALYEDSESAHEAMVSIEEDLADLTKSSFETRYLQSQD